MDGIHIKGTANIADIAEINAPYQTAYPIS